MENEGRTREGIGGRRSTAAGRDGTRRGTGCSDNGDCRGGGPRQLPYGTQFAADRALDEAEAALEDIDAAQASILSLTGAYDEALAQLAGMTTSAQRYASAPPPSGTRVPSGADLLSARHRAEELEVERARATRSMEAAEQRLEEARRAASDANETFWHAENIFADAIIAARSPALDTSSKPVKDFTSALGTLTAIEKTSGDSPTTVMTLLSRLTLDQLTALLAADTALVQRFWDQPPPPGTVSGWWHGLSEELRQAYITAAPGIIGNLPGIPYADRHTANWISYQKAVKNPGLPPRAAGGDRLHGRSPRRAR